MPPAPARFSTASALNHRRKGGGSPCCHVVLCVIHCQSRQPQQVPLRGVGGLLPQEAEPKASAITIWRGGELMTLFHDSFDPSQGVAGQSCAGLEPAARRPALRSSAGKRKACLSTGLPERRPLRIPAAIDLHWSTCQHKHDLCHLTAQAGKRSLRRKGAKKPAQRSRNQSTKLTEEKN
jgi:hypothetical protein